MRFSPLIRFLFWNVEKELENERNSLVYIIGLTGSLGSGKSTVARMFAVFGAQIIDADKIAHQQMQPGTRCFRLIVKMFGKDILTSGRINRKKVAAQVFRDPKKLRKLERIIHPAVRKIILLKIKQYKRDKRNKAVVIDVPLLFEAKLNNYVDRSIVVKANKTVQIARAVKLLGITKAEAQRRIKAQMPLRQKIRLADMIIDNNATLTQTQKQVKQIWERL